MHTQKGKMENTIQPFLLIKLDMLKIKENEMNCSHFAKNSWNIFFRCHVSFIKHYLVAEMFLLVNKQELLNSIERLMTKLTN